MVVVPAGAPLDHFLQKDLLQGHIYYQHSGDENFQDAFDITLEDTQRPPNLSLRYVSRKHTSTFNFTFNFSWRMDGWIVDG